MQARQHRSGPNVALWPLVRRVGWLLLALALLPADMRPAQASEPNVILEVQVAEGRVVGLSLDDLRALPLTEFETSTVWTLGVDTYSGVLLRDLLQHLGHVPDHGPVTVRALDGYSAVIEPALITEQAPLVSFLRNGAPMPVRDRGPIWLIFPYDQDTNYRTESIYAKSVWQVRAIEIKP